MKNVYGALVAVLMFAAIVGIWFIVVLVADSMGADAEASSLLGALIGVLVVATVTPYLLLLTRDPEWQCRAEGCVIAFAFVYGGLLAVFSQGIKAGTAESIVLSVVGASVGGVVGADLARRIRSIPQVSEGAAKTEEETSGLNLLRNESHDVDG